jgi:hypothetical protein
MTGRCYDTEEKLRELYETAKEARKAQGGTLDSHFQKTSATERDKTIYDYLLLIILKSLPSSYVEDPIIRRFSKHKTHISIQTVSIYLCLFLAPYSSPSHVVVFTMLPSQFR